MAPIADNPVIAPDRELEEVCTAAHPLPALRLVASQGESG
jgi:hypothetical protein